MSACASNVPQAVHIGEHMRGVTGVTGVSGVTGVTRSHVDISRGEKIRRARICMASSSALFEQSQTL
jgi:hypothetical protein